MLEFGERVYRTERQACRKTLDALIGLPYSDELPMQALLRGISMVFNLTMDFMEIIDIFWKELSNNYSEGMLTDDENGGANANRHKIGLKKARVRRLVNTYNRPIDEPSHLVQRIA